MPFISQRQIATDLRAQAEKDYRKQLRAALLTPGLSAEQRQSIQAQLLQLGQPKVYDRNSPPVPGAIVLPPTSVQPSPVTPVLKGHDLEVLRGMKKADLQALAEQQGLPTTGTRAELLERLTAA